MGGVPKSRVRFVLVVACVVVLGLSALGPPVAPAAAAAQCASLGAAADFAVFSDGAFNASASSGTSITGRVAAAGDVTLDGVFVGPAAGDATPTIVAGGNFTGGQTTHAGGTVSGGVTYGGTSNVAQNFTVNGGLSKAAPPFTFATEFDSLKAESSSLAGKVQSSGATVVLQPWLALQLTGTAPGLNVFTVSAAQLAQAQGIVIDLTQPGATALINVTTDTQLTIAPQYMNLLDNASPADILWNFPLATGLATTTGVAWQGTILAPNATVTSSGHPQLHGQLIADTVPASDWVVQRTAFTGCLSEAPSPPDTTLTLTPLCIDAAGNLDMRLRNTGTTSRAVVWNDMTGGDFGQFVVPAQSDQFFVVRRGNGASVIRAVSGTTAVQANGTAGRCGGQITVQLATVGNAPAGQTWSNRLTDGANGQVADLLALAAGQSRTLSVPGGYVPGPAPIGGVVGGVLYTVSVDNPLGAIKTTISLPQVEILNGQDEFVLITLTYGGAGETGLPPGGGTPPPVQPTLPPAAPRPLPGPALVPGISGADLAISQQITPSRVRLGNVVRTVTVVRNLGNQTAVGVVAREIPQLRPTAPNTVAHVLSLTTTAGTCTHRRPVRCSLGTLAPGATVTIRTRTRILVAARLTSTVTVSSDTSETNTTNNTASAAFTATSLRASIHAGINAPPTGNVAAGLSYAVTARSGGPGSASRVRLCTRPPSGFVQILAPGTFRFRGLYCRNYPNVTAGRSVSFRVYGFPSGTGRLLASARATAVGVEHASRAAALIDVAGPAVACPAASSTPRGDSAPPAHAAC